MKVSVHISARAALFQNGWEVWILATHLEDTSYLLWMTLQGIPATRTEFWMSSARWPRLEPEMVTTVPPSTGPETGSNLKCESE